MRQSSSHGRVVGHVAHGEQGARLAQPRDGFGNVKHVNIYQLRAVQINGVCFKLLLPQQLGHIADAQRQQHLAAFKHQPMKAWQQTPQLLVELFCQRFQCSVIRPVGVCRGANRHRMQHARALRVGPPSLPRTQKVQAAGSANV